MTAPLASAPPNTAFLPPAPAPALLGPLLAWLVARSGLDGEGFAAVAAADPESVAPGANDPVRLAGALAAAHLPYHALTLVGAALPPREGVWWAWVAVRHAQHVVGERAAAAPVPGSPSPVPSTAAERVAVAAIERWIGDPSDANRRSAWDAGQAADLATPAGAACAAAFFTSGSIAAAHSPMAVPPPPGAHVQMAATAVLLASIQVDAGRLPALVEAAVAQAAEVARRIGGWDAAATLARRHYETQREQHAAVMAAAAPPRA